MSKWTREDYEKALSLREQGLSFARIQKRTGIPVSTVQHWVKGVKPRSVWTEEESKQRSLEQSERQIGKKAVNGKLVEVAPKRSTSRGRKKAREKMRDEPKICYFCKGMGEPHKWVVHHIDENESNNARDNLAWAHEFCNKSYHRRKGKWSQEMKNRFRKSGMALRKCKDCGLEGHTDEDLEKFSKHNQSRFGRQNLCKDCKNKRLQVWREKQKHDQHM